MNTVRMLRSGGRPARCRKCRRPIQWIRDDRAVWRPFTPEAQPLTTHESPEGIRYAVYDVSAFHKCPSKQEPRP